MSKDKIEVNMNVYDIPIVIEELEKAEDTIRKLQKENQQLKHNRDKAIEYINNWLDGTNNDDIIIVMNNLGNILKGGSDE